MELKNIYAAFVKAQQAFAPAIKGSLNPHYKSKYADLAACIEAVIDALNENGIGLIQKTHQDDTGAIVETLFVHTSGESMSGGVLHVPASKQDAQGYGSALSYARRYSLMAACGIAPEDDDGNAASKPRRAKGALKHSPTQDAVVEDDRRGVIVDTAESVKCHFEVGDVIGAYEDASGIIDPEEKIALWRLLPSNIRSALKKHAETLKEPA